MDILSEFATNPQWLFRLIIAACAGVVLFIVAGSMFESDALNKRLKAVASERNQIRERERARMNQTTRKLRDEGNDSLKNLVAKFNLRKYFGAEEDKAKLAQAGFRKTEAQYYFLVARAVCPLALLFLASVYLLTMAASEASIIMKIGGILAAGYFGFKLPDIWVKNLVGKRQTSMRLAFPDALDLLLICVESGMPAEQAFKRVSDEIGVRSVPLAEELAVLTAELSYLPNRRAAYEAFASRTGLEEVKNITTVLIQAESYGTPLGTALRVVAQESRDTRMSAAEKKAAALPPKLTVPMILFFLPVLFAVILTPAFIQISRNNL